jgi:hypothetical protein
MKLIKNWKNKWRVKFKSKVRREYRKEADEKIAQAIRQNEINTERTLQEKDKEIDKLHEHYKKEIDSVRVQTVNYWKNLLTERDNRIALLENDKLKVREEIQEFKQLVQDFESMYANTKIEIEAAGQYIKKGQQKLLRGSGEWETFTGKYTKALPKIQNKLGEE